MRIDLYSPIITVWFVSAISFQHSAILIGADLDRLLPSAGRLSILRAAVLKLTAFIWLRGVTLHYPNPNCRNVR